MLTIRPPALSFAAITSVGRGIRRCGVTNFECYFNSHHHHSVLPKGSSFTANSGNKATVLLKDRSSTANSETRAAVLLGMNRCDSFPLLFTLMSIKKVI